MRYPKLLAIIFVSTLLMCSHLFAQYSPTLDWKMHDVGHVRQLVNNVGALWYTITSYPGQRNCEYPHNSGEEHIGEAGIWVGAITPNNDTLVSVSSGWNVPSWPIFEFFPTDQPWDTIWVVNQGQTVNIPYWPNYEGTSHQDFVCRYSDDNVTNIAGHTPMPLDVIQTSHIWNYVPVILYNFYVISTQMDLQDVYIAYWLDGNVGYCIDCRSNYAYTRDDLSLYYPDQHLGVAVDSAGGPDGTAFSPIGVKLYPPDNHPANSLDWSFNWFPGGNVPSTDAERYRDMAAGTIMPNQQSTTNGSQFIVSFGPFNLSVGDTLHFRVGELFGDGVQGVMTNAHILDSLLVGVEPVSDNLPYHYALFQNCPNPFNPTTTIKYSIAKAGRVKIRIYDILGREVETVVNKQMPVGEYEVRFDAAHLSSGLYFYKISSGEFTKTKKMLLLK